ncbi:uncharacterized protein [Halyomorpha halys]|uniref:uncharacterized protein n=1 Tax=Halyomorpha halys TaxID=286706 RepID=UPI0006D4C896|nr:uncharacterized protein LOC106692099 [Halyomorpha halys]
MKKSNVSEEFSRSIFVRMYQRSNVLHERQDDHMQFSVPILIGGRWVRCDRGRRLFPNDSNPDIDPTNDLLKRERENYENKWNFNFLSESPRPDGEWEWIPREVIVQSDLDGIVGQAGETENGDLADDDDDDDGDLQVVESQQDSEDDSDGSPEIKRARMISVDHI